ncbi:sensor histidine kinase [Paenibacillus sp. 1001270B_150601_E10]|uniref:sensor histidine kinase n=1 Tax=Paenibacillus sp. 1001270B_150601_E10 TaxID=2787079 RepID=UPI00189DC7A1|nr:HAMP domain-containing sensor histidine kinase [Paenibacillus sp. 1001270B_150601_E10]
MSIRIKLLLSYTGMLVISLVMFALTAILITVAITGDIHSLKDFYKVHYQLNPLTEQEESIFLELKSIAKKNPDQLLDKDLLEEYDFKLRIEQAALYVRREKETLFKSYTFHQPNMDHALPDYDLNNNQIRNTFNVDERFYSYAKYDFSFSDGQRGSVFVIRERSPFGEMTRRLLPILLVLLAGVLILANLLLYRWITKTVVNRLNLLRDSANHIKDGNLNFKLELCEKDEIGQLNEAFESMRLRLQESVDLRFHYEENRKELISNISHDLRTPITTIKGYVEGIRDGVADTPEKMERYVHMIYSKAVDLDRLVDELFLYSKLDLKQVPFNFQQVDMRRFLEDCMEELSYDLESKGIHLEWDLNKDEPVEVMLDLEKMKRVILNIIMNAVQYMDKSEKSIQLSLHSDHESVTVEIKDNGIGIPKEAISHIFERFYRAEPSRNSASGGSGLGLAIARQIIDGHGGEIWASSEQGKGTSLFFRLNKARPKERTSNETNLDH